MTVVVHLLPVVDYLRMNNNINNYFNIVVYRHIFSFIQNENRSVNGTHTRAGETPTTLLYRSRLIILFPATIITLTDVCSEIYYIMCMTFAGDLSGSLRKTKQKHCAVEFTHCDILFWSFNISTVWVGMEICYNF